MPYEPNLQPKYGSYDGALGKNSRRNKLQHLVSDRQKKRASDNGAPVQISQDVKGYAGELAEGTMITYRLPPRRQLYLLCIEGAVTVNGKRLPKYDACEIQSRDENDGNNNEKSTDIIIEAVDVESTENGDVAHILMFTMAKVEGSGRNYL